MPLAITPTTPRVLVGTLLTRTGKTPSATSLAQGCCKIIPRLTVRDIEYSIRPLVWINQSSDTSYKPSFRDRHVRRHTDKNVVPDFRTNRLPNYRISPFDAISTDCDCCGRTGFVPRLENGGRLMWLCWATSRLPGRGVDPTSIDDVARRDTRSGKLIGDRQTCSPSPRQGRLSSVRVTNHARPSRGFG